MAEEEIRGNKGIAIKFLKKMPKEFVNYFPNKFLHKIDKKFPKEKCPRRS